MTYLQKRFSNKYGAKKSTFQGKQFDSKFEASVAESLEIRKLAKDIKDWERQFTIPINFKKNKKGEWIITDEPIIDLKNKGIECRHFRDYRIDFKVIHNDNSVELIEAKGMELEPFKMKFFLTELIYENKPNCSLTVVKQQNNYQYLKQKYGKKK